MLAENIDRWYRETQKEGRQAGRRQEAPLERHLEELLAEKLLRLLRSKLGRLEPEVEDRIRRADAGHLLQWGESIRTAVSVQDVFSVASDSFEDSITRLRKDIDRWTHNVRERGREEGSVEVQLLRLLCLKFGPLEPEIEEQVRSAGLKRLRLWGERVLTAAGVQDVFRDLISATPRADGAPDPQGSPPRLHWEDLDHILVENLDRWSCELRGQGRQEGLQEGEAKMLLRQLTLKFGPLDSETEEQVRSADSDRLLQWGGRVLTAGRLEDVFRE